MAVELNLGAGTFAVDGKTYEFAEAGIQNPRAYDNQSLIDLIEGINLDALTPREDTAEFSTKTLDVEGKSSEELKAMKEELEAEKQENLDKMEAIEEKVEELIDKSEELVEKAIKQQEDDQAEYEEESKKIVKEQMKAYVDANKEGEDGMSRQELQSNITGALKDIAPGVAETFNAIAEATGLLDEVDTYIGELRTLIIDTQAIEGEISALDGSIAAAEAAEAAACDPPPSCDPIGFETEDGARYDFIVADEDGFNETSDFLGAEDQWAEMEALDTSGDGIVSIDEFEAANIKMVKTDANGSQSEVGIREIFGDDFAIDLSTYKDANTAGYNGNLSTGDADNDGTLDQELVGTFEVQGVADEAIQGYNTLDDVDWLAENYNIDIATETEDTEEAAMSEELQMHADKVEIYEQRVEALRKEIGAEQEKFDLSEEELEAFNATLKAEAEKNAADFLASLDDITEEEVIEESTETEGGAGTEEGEEQPVISGETVVSETEEQPELPQQPTAVTLDDSEYGDEVDPIEYPEEYA